MVKLAKMSVISGTGPGTRTYVFRSNPLLYTSIAAETGIVKASVASEQLPLSRIEDLLLYNVLSNVNVMTGIAGTKRKTAKLLCKSDLTEAAEAALLGKTIPQGTITSVAAGLNAEFYL